MNILRIWKRAGHDGAHRSVAFLLRDADNPPRCMRYTTGVDRRYQLKNKSWRLVMKCRH